MKLGQISAKTTFEEQKFIFFNQDFPLEITNSKIIGFISNQSNSINENYISSIGLVIAEFLKQNNLKKILINNSDNNFGIAFGLIFYNILAHNSEIKVKIFDESWGYSQKLAHHYFINNDFDFFINIEVNLTDKNSSLAILSFFKKNLTFLSADDEKLINKAEKCPFLSQNSQIKKPKKFRINWNDIIEFQKSINLDLQKLEKFYQFYEPESTFLTNFLKRNFDLKTAKFLPIRKNAPIENIMKKISDNSIIWKKLTTSAKFKTNVVFWLKQNKILAGFRKNFNFNIIKEKDLQLLFLDYLRKNWQNGRHFLISKQSDSYIFEFVQKNFNAKIKSFCEYTENPETEIIKIQSQEQQEIVIIMEKSFYFIPKSAEKSTVFGLSSHFSVLWYIKVFDFYLKNNQNILEIIQTIKTEINYVFHHKFKLKIDPVKLDNIINLLISEKDGEFKPQGFKIKNFSNDKNVINLKVNLKKKDFYTLTYFKPKKQLTLSTNFLAKNHTEKQAVFLENSLIDKIRLVNKDSILTKTNQKKNIIKFSCFITTIIVILIILFYNFYNSSFSDGSTTRIFEKFYEFFFKPRKNRLVLLGVFGHFLLWNISTTFQLRQIFKNQGIKTKFRHLFIGTFIALFMQFSTPFSFGGEISYYWYLQRKQYPLKNISATLTYNALLHQVFNLLIAIIFLPVGFVFYPELFVFDSWEKIAFFTWLITNIILNMFVLLIIIIISLWKKLQYSLIKMLVWLLNLNFFKKIEDKKRVEYRFQFLIDNFKNHFIKILSNKALLTKILLIYKLPLFFLNFSFVILITAMEKGGFNLKNLSFIHYLKFISGFTILQISNNLSPSPGGVGSVDVITKLIFQSFFNEKTTITLDIFNFANRIYTWFLPYFISALGILTVWIGEKRIDYYQQIRQTMKNNSILNLELKKQNTNFFKYALFFWTLVIFSLILFIFLH